MPNRYVRASAIESEPVNALSWQGEVFYRRLLNRADDFGRYTANINLLRAALFPLQMGRVSVKDTEKLLAECAAVGLLFLYQAQGKPLLVMNKWEKGRALRSEYAEPPAEIIQAMKTYVYTCKHKKTYVPDSDSDSVPDTDPDHYGLSPLGVRIGGWFKRREKTNWSEKELKALQKVESLKTSDEDLALLEAFYKSDAPFKRHDIVTLLNNWNGEIDRARGWKEGRNAKHNGNTPPNPRNVGTIASVTNYGEAAKRKLERQAAERSEREMAVQVAENAAASSATGGDGA